MTHVTCCPGNKTAALFRTIRPRYREQRLSISYSSLNIRKFRYLIVTLMVQVLLTNALKPGGLK
ncbi:hypothetical protein BDW60DRAFT_201564 [Aspergillus nidulans var. acristatus]